MVLRQFYYSEDFAELAYDLDENQSMFTSSVENALHRIKERNDGKAFPITIFLDDKKVGFFVLDFGNDKLPLSEIQKCVLLRSLSINPDFQGKGIGKASMLQIDAFVRENFPDCNEVVLAVNEKNTLAFELYLKTGYLYEGKIIEGRVGPQFVIFKKL